MLSNYFKIALRHLMRNKAFSIINILGLAIGISCCLMILLYVQDETNFDQFHEKGDQIHRVALDRQYPGRTSSYAIIPHSFADVMKKDFPEVNDATRIFAFGGDTGIKQGETIYQEPNVIWGDTNVFEVFTFPLLEGDSKTVLSKPNSVVLTETMAKKYFPEGNAVGQTLDLVQEENDMLVTGICKDIPTNSHFSFNMIRSSNGLNFIKQANYISFSAYTYLVLNKNADLKKIESKFPQLVEKYASGPVMTSFGVNYKDYQKAGNGYRYYLQPIQDIHLHSQLEGELSPPGSLNRVYIFTIIAFFILLIACINFMNLATARSVERAREVGIRKTLGSERWQIAAQFLFEAIILSLIATVFAWGMLQYFLPLFNELANKQFSISQIVNWTYAPFFILFAIVIGLLAGSYPAISISSFDPLVVLRGSFWANKKGNLLRNTLVVFQFGISVALIICTIVVYNQLNFIQTKELGFTKDHIISVQSAGFLTEQQTETFKNQLQQLPDVESVGGCNTQPGGFFFGMSMKPEGENEMVTGRGLVVDHGYLECMQMDITKGRGFSKEFSDSLAIIINESAAKELELTNPVGKILATNDQFLRQGETEQTRYKIVGVVKDFHFQSLHQKITPLFFVHHNINQRVDNLISVRMNSNNIQSTIAQIEQIWEKALPGQPFSFTFLDKDLSKLYTAEQTAQKVFTLFAILAILIACMGLLGLAAYITQLRTREIGIRKVLGASVENIVGLLSKEFIVLVLVALLIASPISWYLMNEWLENFAYRIDMQWWMFALAGVLAIFIAFATVSYQSIRAALSNPIKALKQE